MKTLLKIILIVLAIFGARALLCKQESKGTQISLDITGVVDLHTTHGSNPDRHDIEFFKNHAPQYAQCVMAENHALKKTDESPEAYYATLHANQHRWQQCQQLQKIAPLRGEPQEQLKEAGIKTPFMDDFHERVNYLSPFEHIIEKLRIRVLPTYEFRDTRIKGASFLTWPKLKKVPETAGFYIGIKAINENMRDPQLQQTVRQTYADIGLCLQNPSIHKECQLFQYPHTRFTRCDSTVSNLPK